MALSLTLSADTLAPNRLSPSLSCFLNRYSPTLSFMNLSLLRLSTTNDNAPVIDVTQYDSFKVLGKGVLPSNQLVVVMSKLISEKKIKKAGGAVLLTA